MKKKTLLQKFNTLAGKEKSYFAGKMNTITNKKRICMQRDQQRFGVTHQSGWVRLLHHKNSIVKLSLHIIVSPPSCYVI